MAALGCVQRVCSVCVWIERCDSIVFELERERERERGGGGREGGKEREGDRGEREIERKRESMNSVLVGG